MKSSMYIITFIYILLSSGYSLADKGFIIELSNGETIKATSVKKEGSLINYSTPQGYPGFLSTKDVSKIVKLDELDNYSPTQQPGDYHINIRIIEVGRYSVTFEIVTNIRGSIVLSANIALKGQKDNDIFFGTRSLNVPICNGTGIATINGNKFAMPYKSKLPTGEYNVEVTFYPNWTGNKEVADRAKIKEPINGIASVSLAASGISASSAKARENGQIWVMENFTSQPWKPDFWQRKFGKFTQVELRGGGNPRILKMYYFESIDMTLMVNVLKHKIITYRFGFSHK